MSMKKCKNKACGEQIAKSAKVCPKCGQKQKMNLMLRIILLIIAISIVAGIANLGENNDTTHTQVKMGESFQYRDFEVTVINTNQKKLVGNAFFNYTAGEGATFVCVQWKYKNTSDDAKGIFSTPDLYLYSPEGTRYESDSMASSGYLTELGIESKAFANVNPGITVKDAEVFEVSVDALKQHGWKFKAGSTEIEAGF